MLQNKNNNTDKSISKWQKSSKQKFAGSCLTAVVLQYFGSLNLEKVVIYKHFWCIYIYFKQRASKYLTTGVCAPFYLNLSFVDRFGCSQLLEEQTFIFLVFTFDFKKKNHYLLRFPTPSRSDYSFYFHHCYWPNYY